MPIAEIYITALGGCYWSFKHCFYLGSFQERHFARIINSELKSSLTVLNRAMWLAQQVWCRICNSARKGGGVCLIVPQITQENIHIDERSSATIFCENSSANSEGGIGAHM